MSIEDLHPEATYLSKRYKELDLSHSCIFTGGNVRKRKGEHVIPKWMIKEYSLHQGHLEMAQRDKISKISEFRAPATKEANENFGRIEQKIKFNIATKGELFLWGMKVSLGIMINHHRMSINQRHPNAPRPVDDRGIRGMLKSFHESYQKWCESGEVFLDAGSVTQVATTYDRFFLGHLFGAIQKNSLSEKHDLILPYGAIILLREGILTIISIGGSLESIERINFVNEWNAKAMHKSKNLDEIKCFISICYFESAFHEVFQMICGMAPSIRELKLIAYQLGILIVEKEGVLKYTSRNNPNFEDPKLFYSLANAPYNSR